MRRGFTLIEILVVMAILAVLAAVILPNMSGVVNNSKVKANQAELSIVQTALDTYMADKTLGSVAVQGSQKDFSMTDPVLWPDYLRIKVGRCAYSWNATGMVSQTVGSCP